MSLHFLLHQRQIREGTFDVRAAFLWSTVSQNRSVAFSLRRAFSTFNFAERFDYWAHDCNVETRLPRHAPEIFAGCHKDELLAILKVHGRSHYIEIMSWWQGLE